MLAGLLLVAVTVRPGYPALSETAAPDVDSWRAAASLAPAGEFESLVDTSSYQIFLNGFLFGKIRLEGKRDGENFLLRGAANLRPGLGNLYPVEYRGHALMSAKPVQPSEVVMEEEKGAKKMTFRLRFPRQDYATAVQIEVKPGKKPTRTRKEFFSESFVLDPFSTFFLIRSLDWRAGEVRTFDILTGRKQYELQLTCRGESLLPVDGQLREVWEIVPQTRSFEPPRKIKLSGYVMYLSKDSRREILKVTGWHKLGRIVAQLEKMDGQERE